jgi:alpha-L-arabinofuranosidase
MTDYNDFCKPEQVVISEFEVGAMNNAQLQLKIPPHSVVLIQLDGDS